MPVLSLDASLVCYLEQIRVILLGKFLHTGY